MEIKPTTHSKIAYLTNSHAPLEAWSADPGRIQNITVDPNRIVIQVGFEKSWEPLDQRVMVTIKDGDNRTVYEHPVVASDTDFPVAIGLRER